MIDMTVVREKLAALGRLPHNWDSYGGLPIKHEIIDAVWRVLDAVKDEDVPEPHLAAGSDGGIQIEWHRSGEIEKILELEFQNHETICCLKWARKMGIEEEFDFPASDLERVRELLRWFSSKDAS